jgi:hypothetical protein
VKRVFLGGSRRVARLNAAIRGRLEELIKREMPIIIGDANGADRAMQCQLADWGYRNVEVFYVGRAPRNNAGSWPTRRVPTPTKTKGFDFYAAKDLEMAREAECGFMLWDGESRGTLANVENLIRVGKPVVLYISPAHRFVALRTNDDLAGVRRVLVAKGNAESPLPSQTDLGFGDTPAKRKPRSGRRTA